MSHSPGMLSNNNTQRNKSAAGQAQSKKTGQKQYNAHMPQRSAQTSSADPGVRNDDTLNTPTAHTSPSANGSAAHDDHAHDRMLFLLANARGRDATITLKNGDKFTGVFSGATVDPPRYIFRMTCRAPAHSSMPISKSAFVGNGQDHVMAWDMQDTVDLAISNVQFSSSTRSSAPGANAPSFKTDVEISGNAGVRERELHRWQPGPATDVDLSLGDSRGSSGIGNWDQFAANEKLYNVRSDYDENLYTTVIDRSNPKHKQLEEKAARIAQEMERDAASAASTQPSDTTLTEEDKYSGVRRTPLQHTKPAQDVYVPPSRRSAQTKASSVETPIDSAIISSQLARPSNSPKSATPRETSNPLLNRITASGAGAISMSKTSSAAGPASALPKAEVSADKSDNPMQNVLESFKAFSSIEKQRMKARNEKSMKLNDLKKFSQSFQLHSRVPEDLVPILAKSKEKQDEIRVKAEQQARHKELVPIDTPTSTPTASMTLDTDKASVKTQATAPSTTASQSKKAHSPVTLAPVQTPTTTSQHTGPKLNVKALSFRPNPGAASFAPASGNGFTPSRSQRPSISSPAPAPSARMPAAFTFRGPPLAGPNDIFDDAFNPLQMMLHETAADEQKKDQFVANGGIPQAYRTAPIWAVSEQNQDKSYVDVFMRATSPIAHSVARTYSNGPMSQQQHMPASPKFYPGVPQMMTMPPNGHMRQPQYMMPHMNGHMMGPNRSMGPQYMMQPMPGHMMPMMPPPGAMHPQPYMPGQQYPNSPRGLPLSRQNSQQTQGGPMMMAPHQHAMVRNNSNYSNGMQPGQSHVSNR